MAWKKVKKIAPQLHAHIFTSLHWPVLSEEIYPFKAVSNNGCLIKSTNKWKSYSQWISATNLLLSKRIVEIFYKQLRKHFDCLLISISFTTDF